MTFTETKLSGAYLIRQDRHEDERGYFARTFSKNEFEKYGLNSEVVQSDISFNKKKGTFCGMHFQSAPFHEEKIVSCVQGAILYYIVDLRGDSRTFKEWVTVELSSDNGTMLYVPKSFAHGFLTLRDNTWVSHQMTEYPHSECSHGFRFDDPAFDIRLPFEATVLTDHDRNYPDLYVLPA